MRILPALLIHVLVMFVVPAPDARAADSSIVSFTLDLDGGIVLPVAIGGAGPLRFMLDTGSSHSAISDAVAARLGLRPVARAEMATSAGPIMVPVALVASLSVGAVTADRLLVSVIAAAELRQLGAGVDGVLGQDVLAAHDFTIDYRRKRLVWDDAAGSLATGSAAALRLPLTMEDGRPVATLAQASPDPLRLVPDTGSAALVLYDRQRRSGLRLSPVDGEGDIRLTSLAGVRTARLMRLHELRVGDVTLRDRVVVLVPPSSRAHQRVDGLLPLHHFSRVSFRFGERALMIER